MRRSRKFQRSCINKERINLHKMWAQGPHFLCNSDFDIQRDILYHKKEAKMPHRSCLTAGKEASHFIYSSSRNTRDFSQEKSAQGDTRPHREYDLAMKNKSLRRIADVRSRGRFKRRTRRGRNAGAFLNIKEFIWAAFLHQH